MLGIKHLDIGNFHIVARDRTSLIDAKDIYACKRLDTLHVVQKNFLFAEPHCAKSQSYASEKEEAFWNHANNRRNNRTHAFETAELLYEIALCKENDCNRNNCDASNTDNLVKRANNLGLLALVRVFCLQSKLVNVAFCADLCKSCKTLTGHNKASGHEFRINGLVDFVGFTSKQSFINGNVAIDNNGISHDLVAGLKHDDIVFD